MVTEVLPVGPLQCNCCIFGDEAAREAIVVDPGGDLAAIRQALARHGLKVTAIVITHAHIDHIGAAARLQAESGAPVYLNDADRELYRNMEWQASFLGIRAPELARIDVSPRDGDRLRAGETEFQVLHTPGHSQGSIAVWTPAHNTLAAGDTLFRGSIGRTDLPGGDGAQILRSIHGKLMALPDETRVIAGHGPETTIGAERARNPFLRG